MKHDLEKITIRIYSGDKERLEELFPHYGGHNKIIRDIVRNYIQQKEKENGK